MQVEFGASVIGVAGKRLGEVEGLIVDAGTKRARSLVVDAGVLDRSRHMVGVSAITRVDDEGLHLDDTAARTEAQSPIIDSEEVSFEQRVAPPTEYIPAAGVGGPVVAIEPPVPGSYPDEGSFFEFAPLDPPPVEIESNLLENEVVLGKSTRAISSDGHEVGDVDTFALGDMGLVDAIGVSHGLLRKERFTVRLADIGEFGTDKVHLKLTKAQADALGRSA